MNIKNQIGNCLLEEAPIADTLKVALCLYFDSQENKPDNDPMTEAGWSEWVMAKSDEALNRICFVVDKAYQSDSRYS